MKNSQNSQNSFIDRRTIQKSDKMIGNDFLMLLDKKKTLIVDQCFEGLRALQMRDIKKKQTWMISSFCPAS